MTVQQWWKLIEDARAEVPDPSDCDEVAGRVTARLSGRPAAEIVAAEQVLRDRLAVSYRAPLWAAAYIINGGCSDDGFDYFRGWLIPQGREIFERVIADPDAPAELPAVRAEAPAGGWCDGEAALTIAWDAHQAATGKELLADAFTVNCPLLDPAWNFDFSDRDEMNRRPPALTTLYA